MCMGGYCEYRRLEAEEGEETKGRRDEESNDERRECNLGIYLCKLAHLKRWFLYGHVHTAATNTSSLK